MFLLLLAYFGGVLTILSPCILPVLPFVFARSDQPFRKSGLPLLAGMAITFALVASLATVGGGWAVRANQFGRIAALILFARFWPYPSLLVTRRSLVASAGATGKPAFKKLRFRCKCPELSSAWYRHRLTLGTLCRANLRPHPHRSGAPRRKYAYRRPPSLLRGRSSNFVGNCVAGRRPFVRGHEAFAGRGGVDSPCSRGCRPRCGRRCCLRTRPGRAYAAFPGQHRRPGAASARPVPSCEPAKADPDQSNHLRLR